MPGNWISTIFLKLGRGEEAQGGRNRSSLLADAMEAVIGAVFLDGGYDEAQKFIMRIFANKWPATFKIESSKDFKSKLQEVTQARFKDARPTCLPGPKALNMKKYLW